MRAVTVVVLAVLWVGAVRLIIGAAAPAAPAWRARVGWVIAAGSSFVAGVLSAVPRRW